MPCSLSREFTFYIWVCVCEEMCACKECSATTTITSKAQHSQNNVGNKKRMSILITSHLCFLWFFCAHTSALTMLVLYVLHDWLICKWAMLVLQQTLTADIIQMLLCLCVKSWLCVCACIMNISFHRSVCEPLKARGWAPCQPLSDSTPSHWRIFVSETNGTERINYRHNVGDMPELLGGGGENEPFPCTLCLHPPPVRLFFLLPRPRVSTNGWFESLTCRLSSRHQASVEHRREMAPIPDTPQKPQSHPVIREAQDPGGEADKDTPRFEDIVPLHHSVWQYFIICNIAF